MKLTTNGETTDGLMTLLLGFFGVTAVIFFLPKTIKFFLRKLVFGVVSEVVAVVVTGLLTEKLVDYVGRDRESAEALEPAANT